MTRPARLALAALLAAGAACAATAADPAIRALRWLGPTADLTRAVATQPSECLRRPGDPTAALAVEVGRAAFRTPVLLGGQAARAGLSCEACHRNGRTNPDFQFPGVSGGPGTADVTDSLFSSHRGDGVADPRPIPDLSAPKSALKIDQRPQSRALESFIHGLITEEFDGPEPPPAVLAGVAAYVRALQPAACPANARQPLGAATLMEDARRAVLAARAEVARAEDATAVVMLAAARSRLGLIDERLDQARLSPLRARLRQASIALAQAQAALRQGRRPDEPTFAAWLAASRTLQADLTAAEPASLFDPHRLAALAKRRLPT